MMHITFENDIGRIDIAGGGNNTWRLIDATGLDITKYDAQTVYIRGRDGRQTTLLQSLERSITLKGDVVMQNSNSLITSAAQILDKEGVLKVVYGSKKRMITARCTFFSADGERGGIRPFVMQFICDDPFFTDFDQKTIDIASVNNLIYGTVDFTSEIYFSTARTEATVTNSGVKEAEPVICITSPEAMAGEKIVIINAATEQSLTINHSLSSEDELVIDIPNRTVMLNEIIRYDLLSDDSFLSNFYLSPGNNQVTITTDSNSDRLVADISYYNKYNEAMR